MQVSPQMMKQATDMEKLVAEIVGGEWIGGPDKPFDVSVGRWLIEVKCLIYQGHSKLTVHPSSLRRKKKHAQDLGRRVGTVAVDTRDGGHAFYARYGIGSFRLNTMSRVSLSDLMDFFVV